MAFIDGVILTGDKKGYCIRIEDDTTNTGGYLIIFWNPDDPNIGGDYWVETFDDIQSGIAQVGWDVKWNQPFERFISP